MKKIFRSLQLLMAASFYRTGLCILFCCLVFLATAKRARAQVPNSKADSILHKNTGKGIPSFPGGEKFKSPGLTYKIIPAANNTWCYDILMEGRQYIHQSSAPGLPGNEGFKTKEKAEKVAKLVISKMKKGEMPPSIAIEEMKKLDAL
jgi:Domain of unknown function (DUF4907)